MYMWLLLKIIKKETSNQIEKVVIWRSGLLSNNQLTANPNNFKSWNVTWYLVKEQESTHFAMIFNSHTSLLFYLNILSFLDFAVTIIWSMLV